MLLWALLLLVLGGSRCGAELRTWVVEKAEEFVLGSTQGVQVHPDSLVILEQLTTNENLALGRIVIDDFDKTVPLSDGSIALVRGEWLSGTPNVFGRQFTVDLGLDRAISRVRVLAGESALNQPEYFMRGYRIESATQDAPQVWHLLAEEPANFALNVDTEAEDTWDQVDAQGIPVPRQGRFVRLTLIRQDRTNWVAIGEIEVFGVGYGHQGTIEDQLTPSGPVNVGRIRWQVQRPPRTEIGLRVRGATGDRQAPDWDGLAFRSEDEFLFDGIEPVEVFQYRARLENTAPFVTPALERIEVDYDPDLVARRVLGEVVAPERVAKGVLARLVYRVELDVESGDHGVDMLRLDGPAMEVMALRLDGRDLVHDLALERGYRWSHVFDPEGTVVELAPAERMVAAAVVEVEGEALFVRDKTPIEPVVGSAVQGQRDGYVNWQRGQEAPGGSWTVLASGAPLRLVGKVAVSPQPFSPFAHGTARFEFVVGNIEVGKQVIVEIFSLDGRRLRRLQQMGQVRRYGFDWDGRDEGGRTASPGLYLYEVRVEDSDAGRRGTFVVAY